MIFYRVRIVNLPDSAHLLCAITSFASTKVFPSSGVSGPFSKSLPKTFFFVFVIPLTKDPNTFANGIKSPETLLITPSFLGTWLGSNNLLSLSVLMEESVDDVESERCATR